MKVEFRAVHLCAEDIETYRRIELAIAPGTPGASVQTTIETEEIKKELTEFCANFICVDGEVAGLISCKRDALGGNGLYLSELAITPEHQGKGIGRLALQLLLLPMLHQLGRVWLVTHPKNTSALRLYLGLGFQIQEWKENYFGDGEPRLVLDLQDLERMKR